MGGGDGAAGALRGGGADKRATGAGPARKGHDLGTETPPGAIRRKTAARRAESFATKVLRQAGKADAERAAATLGPGPAAYSPLQQATSLRSSPSFSMKGSERPSPMGISKSVEANPTPGPGHFSPEAVKPHHPSSVSAQHALFCAAMRCPASADMWSRPCCDEQVKELGFAGADRFYEDDHLYMGPGGAAQAQDKDLPGPGAYEPRRDVVEPRPKGGALYRDQSVRFVDPPEYSPGPAAHTVPSAVGTDPAFKLPSFGSGSRVKAGRVYAGIVSPAMRERNTSFSCSPVKLPPSGPAFSFGRVSERKVAPRAARVKMREERRKKRLLEKMAREERRRAAAGEYQWLRRELEHENSGIRGYKSEPDGTDIGGVVLKSRVSYSFGGGERFDRRVHMAHAPNDGINESPGPQYRLKTRVGTEAPGVRFGRQKRLAETPSSKLRRLVPGPGAYDSGLELPSPRDGRKAFRPVKRRRTLPPGQSATSDARGVAPPQPPSPSRDAAGDPAQEREPASAAGGGDATAAKGGAPAGEPPASPSPTAARAVKHAKNAKGTKRSEKLPRGSPRKFGNVPRLPRSPVAPFGKGTRDAQRRTYMGDYLLDKQNPVEDGPGPVTAVSPAFASDVRGGVLPKAPRPGLKAGRGDIDGTPGRLMSHELAGVLPGTIEFSAGRVGSRFSRSPRGTTHDSRWPGFEVPSLDGPGPAAAPPLNFLAPLPGQGASPRPMFPKAPRVLGDVPKDAAATPGPGAHDPR